MKKLITLAVAIILAMSTTTQVMAVEEEEKPIFETDLSVCEEIHLSVYKQGIREEIKGELTDCDCFDFCNCTPLYHILDDTTQNDFYSTFFNGDYLIHRPGRIYQDCSSSMEENFGYEKSNIIRNLSPLLNEKEKDIEDVFKNKKTDLYGLLNSFGKKSVVENVIFMPREIPIIITDLWDTEGKEEESVMYSGQIIFCVPYASTNKEGVVHCEEVVNNILWNHGWIPGNTAICVIYTDNVIVEYSNGTHNFDDGIIEIYVP